METKRAVVIVLALALALVCKGEDDMYVSLFIMKF